MDVVDISEKGREPTKMGREGRRVLTRVNESFWYGCVKALRCICTICIRTRGAYVAAEKDREAEERSLAIDRCEYFPDGLLFED